MTKKKERKTRWAERDKWLCPEEQRILLEHVDNNADLVQRTLVHFILGTGFRVTEISTAKFKDLILDGKPQIRTTGKGAQPRVIPLDSDLVAVLREYIAFRESAKSMRGRWGHKLNGNGLLFPYSTVHIWRLWGAAVRKAGLIRGFHTHAGRHSYASTSYQVHEDLATVRDLMGHKNASTTSLYVHSTEEMRRATVEGRMAIIRSQG